MEEIITSRTFGTIIHDTLYYLYKPFINQVLTVSDIQNMIKSMDVEIDNQFKRSYSAKSVKTGKNLLSLEISRQFVLNFLNYEISEIQKGKRIKILGLEQKIDLFYQVEGLSFPIRLKGTIDRIDQIDQVTRIIDYKTGKVNQSDLNIKNWPDLIEEEKYTKAFQVLCYAYMFSENKLLSDGTSLESGIISFKNLKSGFLKLNREEISDETLLSFSENLDALLLDLFNTDSSFIEKKIPEYY
jgi:ATP-dependent exoDNAse (exonuclease V) beta subunit